MLTDPRGVPSMPDGHAGLPKPDELLDMTRWCDRAARSGDPAWQAQYAVPSRSDPTKRQNGRTFRAALFY